MIKIVKIAFLIMLVTLFSGTSFAKLSISPVRFNLERNFKSAILELKSEDIEDVTYQVSVVKWKRVMGADKFEKTNDLFITPPIFTLKPGMKQTIRFIPNFGAEDKGEGERSYMIDIVEIDKLKSFSEKKSQVKFQLEMMVPLFIKPTHLEEIDKSNLIIANEGKELSIHNRLNRHILVTNFVLDEKKENKIKVIENIFPGEKKQFNPPAQKNFLVEVQDYDQVYYIKSGTGADNN